MHISPRPHRHPIIRAHYVNGASKAICVRNLEKEQVEQKAVLLRDASGVKNKRVTGGKNVKSLNESVRGIWSGMHDAMEGRDIWKTPKKRSKAYLNQI
ncbi:MAG: 39S ribosomal protein L51, mitochondrial [Stictis urceolatum]|nr:39S ribosomal protein L51, mitochondrial [Stictis urceolata]